VVFWQNQAIDFTAKISPQGKENTLNKTIICRMAMVLDNSSNNIKEKCFENMHNICTVQYYVRFEVFKVVTEEYPLPKCVAGWLLQEQTFRRNFILTKVTRGHFPKDSIFIKYKICMFVSVI
jgi:hypothetical protein